MVNWLAGYAVLRTIHMSIGALVLVVVVLRIINRTRHHPPAWPPTVGRIEGRVVIWTERAMYALLLAQPLVGWAMVSASGTPVRVFGVLRLPPIAPFDATVFSVLREAHSILAYALVVIVAAHVSTVLAHSTVLGDGMLRRMTFQIGRRERTLEHRRAIAPEFEAYNIASLRHRSRRVGENARSRRASQANRPSPRNRSSPTTPGSTKKNPPPTGMMYSSSGSPFSRSCTVRKPLFRLR